MIRLLALLALTFAANSFMEAQVTVDCTAGQLLNRGLSKLDKHTPITVSVNGTCSEYVHISGFDGLTLKGLPGATLLQPTGDPGNLFNTVLLIESSRSVVVTGFSVQADTSTVSAIGIGHGSSDIRLRNLKIQGGAEGIIVFENSQVSIANVTAKDPGYTPLGIYDASDVHVEHCLFEDSTGAPWHVGIDVAASHLTIYGTTIRNMQIGVNARGGGIIDVTQFDTYFPLGGSSDVVIESPARTNFNGVAVTTGASLNMGSAKLRITNPGQTWGGNTGGILLSGGGFLNAGPNLVVSNSQGQGVFVTNNSQADLDGSSITGSRHGGLVVVNQSSAASGSQHPPTIISGNGNDIFCDSRSLVTGGANIGNATNVQCANLLPGDTVPIP
jgi:nitrous oxidase accessory protein NosD